MRKVNGYRIKAQSRINKETGDCVEVRIRVYDRSGNVEADSLYNEEIYFEQWKVKATEDMTKYTMLYLVD